MAARVLAALRKARQLSLRDWWWLLRGQAALARAWVDVRTRPQGELARAGRAGGVPPDPGQLPLARQVALGVSRAATYGLFSPTCLVRSMALSHRLEQEGVRGAAIRVGVARRHGKFVAHAWVELAGEVVGDDAGTVDRYQSFDDLHVSSRP